MSALRTPFIAILAEQRSAEQGSQRTLDELTEMSFSIESYRRARTMFRELARDDLHLVQLLDECSED